MSDAHWIGVDLGGTKILAGLFDDDMAVQGRAKEATPPPEAGPSAVFERIDKAVLSEDASRIYAVQGAPASPLKRVAEMPTEQAASTSVAESSVQWQQAAQQAQQQAQLASQQTPTHQERTQPSPGL